MHYLHKILVYIPDVSKEADSMIRDSLVSAIRSHAESETEGFYKEVFDWRETDTAGRWSDAYPENVLLGSDDPNSLYEAVAECYQTQKSEIDHLIALLKSSVGVDIEHIASGIWDRNYEDKPKNGFDLLTALHLHRLSDLLYGRYIDDSLFYDAHEYTARIYKNTLAALKEHPEDWAVVMFDYHN